MSNENRQRHNVVVFGMRIASIELAFMTHLSRSTVWKYLRIYGFEDGNPDAPERFLIEHGLCCREDVERRIKKIKLEHPDYYKKREYEPIFRFGPVEKENPKKKAEKLTYTQELIALGFEPWPSDYELEKRGER